jgi:hypothetical protein
MIASNTSKSNNRKTFLTLHQAANTLTAVLPFDISKLPVAQAWTRLIDEYLSAEA